MAKLTVTLGMSRPRIERLLITFCAPSRLGWLEGKPHADPPLPLGLIWETHADLTLPLGLSATPIPPPWAWRQSRHSLWAWLAGPTTPGPGLHGRAGPASPASWSTPYG